MADLFPKPPRRLRQPTKCVLREQLALAADEIIEQRLRTEAEKVEKEKRAAEEEALARLQRSALSAGLVHIPHTYRTEPNEYPPRAPWWRRIFRRLMP